MTEKAFWRRGERTRLAALAGVSDSYLSDVLHRRRRISQDAARKFQYASTSVTALVIPFSAWVDSQHTDHPAFFGPPKPIKH